jgi:hypothetical protein
MSDIDIIKQLLNGYFLDSKGLKRAGVILNSLNNEVLNRLKDSNCSEHKTLDSLFNCNYCSGLFKP